MRFALVGCGDVAYRYAATFVPPIELAGATDVVPGRAAAFTSRFGGRPYGSLDELLGDPNVDGVLNLSPPQAHAAVVAACLEAGKHVHSEKPLALDFEEATGLVDLAARRGLCLGCSPATLLGEAQQTVWKLVREGAIGTVAVAYAEANHGRIESWHPAPAPLFAVGPLVDVGVYPLTSLTAMFGPARRVTAAGRVLDADRVTLDGVAFSPQAPDFVVAVVELAGAVIVRLTATFYVGGGSRQRGIELHGDRGSILLDSWSDFDAGVELAVDGRPAAPVPLVREPYRGIGWGRALVDFADAVAEGRPPRASGRQAAHVVEILSAVRESLERGAAVEIHSDFEPPEPMDWAR